MSELEKRDFIRSLVRRARQDNEAWAMSWTDSLVDSELEMANISVVSSADGGLSGFILVREPGRAWEITLVAVAVENRGKRVFAELLFQALELRSAAASGASNLPIDLEVRADAISAVRAYERAGFKSIGRRSQYYADGSDAILYRLE